MNFEKSSHKIFQIKYNFVLILKYRKDLFLNEDYVSSIKDIFLELEKRFNFKFETIGFDEDHLHFMLKSVPNYSPSNIFKIVKSISAKEMFKRFKKLKKEYWGGKFWSDGGYVGTVGEGVNADIIRNYIKNQGRKLDQLKIIDFCRLPTDERN